MSSVDVGTAFIRVIPDVSQFRALLQAEVTAATATVIGNVRVNPTLAAVNTAGGSVGAGTAAATAAATANLAKVEKAGDSAAKGLVNARTQSNILQGSLIGLSRISPVAVFGLGLYGSAAIGAGLAVKSAIGSAADFEQQLNTFAAVTGASADEIVRVRQAARDLGADLSLPSVSAGDAAIAMTELAKAGLSVNDTLAASKGVLQLSSAANISAGDAAQIAATQLNAFQLAGDQATRVAELLADASIAAQGEITDFAAGFQQVSAVANQVGLSIEDTTALLTQLGKAGLRGADGGTSLRTALLRLVPTTKEAAQFQKALGISLDETKSIGEQIGPVIEQYRTQLALLTPVQQQQTLTQIFGQDAIRAASIIFGQQEGALRDLTDQFKETNAIEDLSAAKAKGLKGAFGNLQSQAETLGEKVGSFTTGPLAGLVTGLADTVKIAGDAVGALEQFGDAVDGLDIPGTDKKIGDFVTNVIRDSAFAGTAIARETIERIKKARQTVRDEIARQDRLDQLAQGQRPFGIQPIVRPGDAGIDEDVTTAASRAIEPALTAAQKKRRAAIEAAAKADQEAKKIGLEIPLPLQQAVIDAQIRDSLQAELAADNKIVAFFSERLKRITEGTKKYAVVSGQLRDAQEARNQVLNEIDSIAQRQRAERDAAAREAEARAREAEVNERERIAAQEQLARTLLDIQTQALQNRLSIAQGTIGTADDKVAFNAQIRFLDAQRARAKRLADNAKKGTQEFADATLKVKQLDGQIIAIRQQIKNLGKNTGAEGGFTLQQLFDEAANQFNTFGSNISGRNGVLSGQDERAAFGQSIGAQRDPSLGIQGAQLSENEKQTVYLAEIAALIARGATTVPAPITGNRGRIGSLTSIDATKVAAIYGYD